MWLMCFIMDRCLSIQSGKAWMVQEDAVRLVSRPPSRPLNLTGDMLFIVQTIREAAKWAKGYKSHQQFDNYLASLTELLIIMSRFVGTVNPAFGTSSVESIDVSPFLPFLHLSPFGCAPGKRSSG